MLNGISDMKTASQAIKALLKKPASAFTKATADRPAKGKGRETVAA